MHRYMGNDMRENFEFWGSWTFLFEFTGSPERMRVKYSSQRRLQT